MDYRKIFQIQDWNLVILIELSEQTYAWWAQSNLKQPFHNSDAFSISPMYWVEKDKVFTPAPGVLCLVDTYKVLIYLSRILLMGLSS